MKQSRIAATVSGVIVAFGIGLSSGGAQALPQIQDLNWMTGHWVGTYNGLPMETFYSNGSGHMILGMTKIADGSRTDFFEFEQIDTNQDGSLTLRPFPFAKIGVEFPLKELAGERVVFENPQHDFPARIIYEIDDKRELIARIEGTLNGHPASDQFVFKRVN
jgi:hypothetical protein